MVLHSFVDTVDNDKEKNILNALTRFWFFFFLMLSLQVKAQDSLRMADFSAPKSIYDVCKQLQGDTVQFYYNEGYLLVRPACAKIIRKSDISLKTGFFEGRFADRYLNGKTAATGNYHIGKKEGLFSFYYPNGNLEEQGKYSNNKKIGFWKYWYKSGKPHQTLLFTDSDTLIMQFWNEHNKKLVKNGNGYWYRYTLPSNILKIEGYVKNGKKEGRWKRVNIMENSTLEIEDYKQGKLIEGKELTIRRKGDNTYKDNTYMIILNKMDFLTAEKFILASWPCQPKVKKDTTAKEKTIPASYSGGQEWFVRDIRRNFVYPTAVKQQKMKGTIQIGFDINKNGEMVHFIKMSSFGFGMEDELIQVLRSLRKWKPTTVNGKPVITHTSIKFHFDFNGQR